MRINRLIQNGRIEKRFIIPNTQKQAISVLLCEIFNLMAAARDLPGSPQVEASPGKSTSSVPRESGNSIGPSQGSMGRHLLDEDLSNALDPRPLTALFLEIITLPGKDDQNGSAMRLTDAFVWQLNRVFNS
jgi:hypothetical protein